MKEILQKKGVVESRTQFLVPKHFEVTICSAIGKRSFNLQHMLCLAKDVL